MKTQVTLVLKEIPSVPVEAESINPENVTGKGIQEIESMLLWCGNSQARVGDYFDVSITLTEETKNSESDSELNTSVKDQNNLAKLVLQGDLSKFKHLGHGMAAGEMEIQGSAGFHAGAFMRGGTLTIHQNAADWLGAHMEGGEIYVKGSVGHYAGSAYRGKTKGMTGGMILIGGNAGQMLGARMSKGLIAIGGNCGDAPGYSMMAGTILIQGTPGIRVGAFMNRGTIILFQPNDLLPTFYYNSIYKVPFWSLLYHQLIKKGFSIPASYQDVFFRRYSGDANEGGKGEVLICQSH